MIKVLGNWCEVGEAILNLRPSVLLAILEARGLNVRRDR
jgi:hypothetical protein